MREPSLLASKLLTSWLDVLNFFLQQYINLKMFYGFLL